MYALTTRRVWDVFWSDQECIGFWIQGIICWCRFRSLDSVCYLLWLTSDVGTLPSWLLRRVWNGGCASSSAISIHGVQKYLFRLCCLERCEVCVDGNVLYNFISQYQLSIVGLLYCCDSIFSEGMCNEIKDWEGEKIFCIRRWIPEKYGTMNSAQAEHINARRQYQTSQMRRFSRPWSAILFARRKCTGPAWRGTCMIIVISTSFENHNRGIRV